MKYLKNDVSNGLVVEWELVLRSPASSEKIVKTGTTLREIARGDLDRLSEEDCPLLVLDEDVSVHAEGNMIAVRQICRSRNNVRVAEQLKAIGFTETR